MRVAIFDLDGTLAATNAVDSACFLDAFRAEFGFTPSSDWASYEHCTDEGITIEAVETRLGARPTPPQLSSVRERLGELLRTAAESSPHLFLPVPGAAALLRHLARREWKVCIATGAWRVSAECKLAAARLPAGLPVFPCDGLASREAILAAAIAHARTEVREPIDRVVAVGDGVWDVAAAARLGLPFVGVGTGAAARRLFDAGAAVVLADFRDLPAAMSALESASEPLAS